MVSLLTSAPIAAAVGYYFQRHLQTRQQKFDCFCRFMSFKHDVQSKEFIGAMNEIRWSFADSSRVVTAWDAFYRLLSSQTKTTQQAEDVLVSLIKAMAADLRIKLTASNDNMLLAHLAVPKRPGN